MKIKIFIYSLFFLNIKCESEYYDYRFIEGVLNFGCEKFGISPGITLYSDPLSTSEKSDCTGLCGLYYQQAFSSFVISSMYFQLNGGYNKRYWLWNFTLLFSLGFIELPIQLGFSLSQKYIKNSQWQKLNLSMIVGVELFGKYKSFYYGVKIYGSLLGKRSFGRNYRERIERDVKEAYKIIESSSNRYDFLNLIKMDQKRLLFTNMEPLIASAKKYPIILYEFDTSEMLFFHYDFKEIFEFIKKGVLFTSEEEGALNTIINYNYLHDNNIEKANYMDIKLNEGLNSLLYNHNNYSCINDNLSIIYDNLQRMKDDCHGGFDDLDYEYQEAFLLKRKKQLKKINELLELLDKYFDKKINSPKLLNKYYSKMIQDYLEIVKPHLDDLERFFKEKMELVNKIKKIEKEYNKLINYDIVSIQTLKDYHDMVKNIMNSNKKSEEIFLISEYILNNYEKISLSSLKKNLTIIEDAIKIYKEEKKRNL